MKLTKEQALFYHRQMWSDMQKELGDTPKSYQRDKYKEKWINKHFPNENIAHNCFLCEYANDKCANCPVVWLAEPEGYCCTGYLNYLTMPISELLALPERDLRKEN